MNEVKQFKNSDFGELTVAMIGDREYFQAHEAAKMLGYTNFRDAVIRHCKGVVKHDILTGGGRQEVNFIPEGDLYRLIVRSKLPSAEKFEKWVFDEIIPTVRKHGAYMTDDVLAKSISDPAYIIGLLTALNDTKKQINIQNQLIGELKPKADYLDLILKGKSLMTITQIAKDYGMTGAAMNQLLHQYEVQFIQNEQWLLYSEHSPKGYTSSKFIPITRSDGRIDMKLNTQWTQKGRMFIYNTLKKYGILPMIERED